MIFVRPTSPHTFHPCGGPRVACQRPGVHKVFFKACDSHGKQPQTQEKCNETPQPSSDVGRVLVERAPIHFEENAEFAKLALDVAGFSADDIQVRMEDFIVSIDGKRTNKLGDSYVISRRFRVDRNTVSEDDIRASLTEGILEILVPKKSKAGPRSIPISTARSVLETAKVGVTDESTEPSDESKSNNTTEDNKTEIEAAAVDVETLKENDNDDGKKAESNKTEKVLEEESWEEVKE